MDLSIVIVNWNSCAFLYQCLSTIHQFTRDLTYEVIVVDNHSTEPFADLILASFPDVMLIQSHVNLGFARANNLGFSRSSGQAILFLNPDTEIRDNVFAEMLTYLNTHEEVGAVGGCLLNSDGTLQADCIRDLPTIWNQLTDSDSLRTVLPFLRTTHTSAHTKSKTEPSAVEAIVGACILIKRSVFETIGRFTESFFMYGEDVELSYKIGKYGWQLHYLPNCLVIHHGGQSSAKQAWWFAELWQHESRMHFFESTRGVLYARCYKAAVALSSIVKLVALALIVPLEYAKRKETKTFRLFRKCTLNLQWALGIEKAVIPGIQVDL